MKFLILSVIVCLSIVSMEAKDCGECIDKAFWVSYKARVLNNDVDPEVECKMCANYMENKDKLDRLQRQRKAGDEDVYGETGSMHLNHTLGFGLVINEESAKQRRISNYYYRPTVSVSSLPKTFSWVDLGWRSAVRQQGLCGSCYIFAAAGAIEGQYFKCNGRSVSFSEQFMMDCAPNTISNGCLGGDPGQMADYASTIGIPLESQYPYTMSRCSEEDYAMRIRPARCNQPNECPFRRTNENFRIDTVEHIEPNNLEHLKAALYTEGPVLVAVHADDFLTNFNGDFFSGANYRGGKINHAVLAVGYTENAIIIKNSWDTTWGTNGYAKMSTSGRGGANAVLTYMQVVKKTGCKSTADILRGRGIFQGWGRK